MAAMVIHKGNGSSWQLAAAGAISRENAIPFEGVFHADRFLLNSLRSKLHGRRFKRREGDKIYVPTSRRCPLSLSSAEQEKKLIRIASVKLKKESWFIILMAC